MNRLGQVRLQQDATAMITIPLRIYCDMIAEL